MPGEMNAAGDLGLWVVVPAYNEAARIGGTLNELLTFQRQVVVVDDGSADDTAAVALQHPVWVVRHPINRGQGAALQTGIDFALERGAKIVVTFDADGQHAANEISRLIQPIVEGRAEIVLGSRFLGEAIDIPWHRWWILRLGVLFTRVVSGIRVTDTHNGFRAFSRKALREKIRIAQDRMSHASELLDQIHQSGLPYVEMPVTVRYTEASLAKGQSSLSAVRVAWTFLLHRLFR